MVTDLYTHMSLCISTMHCSLMSFDVSCIYCSIINYKSIAEIRDNYFVNTWGVDDMNLFVSEYSELLFVGRNQENYLIVLGTVWMLYSLLNRVTCLTMCLNVFCWGNKLWNINNMPIVCLAEIIYLFYVDLIGHI